MDVPATLSARVRLFDTGHNRKTDAHDAHAVAAVAVRTGPSWVITGKGSAVLCFVLGWRVLDDGSGQGGSLRLRCVKPAAQ